MATVECIFKVGDASKYPAQHEEAQDGTALAIVPPGKAWGPAVVNAYLNSGTIPPNWSDLSDWRQQTTKWAFDRVAALTTPGLTPQDVADIRDPDWASYPQDKKDKFLAQYQKEIAEAEGNLFQWTTFGYDTNWSYKALTQFGVIMLDLTAEQILKYYQQMGQGKYVAGLDPLARRSFVSKRWWRVTYETIFDAGTVTDLQNPGTLVQAPRGMTPLGPGAALEVLT